MSPCCINSFQCSSVPWGCWLKCIVMTVAYNNRVTPMMCQYIAIQSDVCFRCVNHGLPVRNIFQESETNALVINTVRFYCYWWLAAYNVRRTWTLVFMWSIVCALRNISAFLASSYLPGHRLYCSLHSTEAFAECNGEDHLSRGVCQSCCNSRRGAAELARCPTSSKGFYFSCQS